jgi:SAM-dependent methyltransferase
MTGLAGGYTGGRREKPRIAARLARALGDADSVVNVGAGTGSYEPVDRRVVAVEPSPVMAAQRPAGTASCVRAAAEALPFGDGASGAAMAVLSIHQWTDPERGLAEMRRVSRGPVVLFGGFVHEASGFDSGSGRVAGLLGAGADRRRRTRGGHGPAVG